MELYLHFMMYIHAFIWLFVLFAGFFNKKFCYIVLYIILPAIYIIQIYPTHFFMKSKIDYIIKNYDRLSPLDNIDISCITNEEKQDLHQLCNYMEIPYDNMISYFTVYIQYEDIFSKILRKIKLFFERSFKNPASTQGLIILCFITNILYLKYKHKAI